MAGLDPAIRSGTSLRKMAAKAAGERVAINEKWYYQCASVVDNS
jgi:hypothetical protein